MVVAIIGSSIAARSAVGTLCGRLKPGDRVVVITRDARPFYSRVLLPDFIAGHVSMEDLDISGRRDPQQDLEELLGVRIVHGTAVGLDVGGRRVLMERGDPVHFDRLLIATGASPAEPDLPGAGLPHIHTLRNLEDALAVRQAALQAASGADRCLVLGGGLVSLKAAWALGQLGCKVSLLASSRRLLSRVADEPAARMLAETFRANGVEVRLGVGVSRFIGDDRGVSGVELEDGSRVAGALVVVGKGVRPNLDALAGSGMKTDRGILVDHRMETSIEGIYAAGDVAQAPGALSGAPELFTLWPDASIQGRVAGSSLLGGRMRYPGGLSANSVVFYSRPLICIGCVREEDLEGCTVFSRLDPDASVYRKVVVRDRKLVGLVMFGDIRFAGMAYWDIMSGSEAEDPREYLTARGLERLYLRRQGAIRQYGEHGRFHPPAEGSGHDTVELAGDLR